MKVRIARRGKKGTWWVFATLPGGRKYRRSLHTLDRSDADQQRLKIEQELRAGVRPDASLTVAVWLQRWLDDHAAAGRAPTTMATYRTTVDRYLVPWIGAVPLEALSVADVQEMNRRLVQTGGREGRPLAVRSVRNIQGILAAAIHEAQRHNLVLRNVASLARGPALPKGYGPQWLSKADAARLLRAAAGHRWGAFAAIAAYTGLRAGELCGLQWGDVDFDARVLRVERQRRYELGRGYQDAPPKSSAGTREVPLTDETIQWLRAMRERQMEAGAALGGDPPEHLFAHRWRGRWVPLSPHAASGGVGTIYEAAGLPKPVRPLHALRHTLGRALASHTLEVRAAILGHEDAATASWYAHPDGEDLRTAMEQAARRLKGEPT